MSLSLSLLAFVSAVVMLISRSIMVRTRRQVLIRRHGCQPIAKFPSGAEYDRIVRESLKDGTFNPSAMELYEKCGSNTYEVHSTNDRVINTMDPLNHMTMATKTDDWKKDVRRASFPLWGRSLLTQGGPAWRKTRDLIMPLFKRAELAELEFFSVFVDRFIDRIPRDGSTVDLQPLIRDMFLDSITEFIFGESLDRLRDTSGETDKLLVILNKAASTASAKIRPTGYKLIFNNLFSSWDKDWIANCRVVHDYVDGCISRHQSRAKVLSKDRKRYFLIDGMSEQIADPVDLRFQLLGIFSIARETPAMAFSNVIFMLARNPNLWTELRAVALGLKLEGGEITYKQLQNLTLFRYTVLETLRLHSPITRLRRVSTRDTVLPRGGGLDGSAPAFVPKGTRMWGDFFPKTRDPTYWGEDVETFRPSRFEGKRLDWEFSPFSGGPRICPANQQVVVQCMYLLFRLVKEFKSIENRDSCLEFVEVIQMCFESKNGCKVALHPA